MNGRLTVSMLLQLLFICFSGIVSTYGQVSLNFYELQHVLYNINIENKPIVASSVQQHSATGDDLEEIVLVSRFGQPFRCVLPSQTFFNKRSTNLSKASNDLTDEEDQLILHSIDNFKVRPCVRATQDWWTYELCYKQSIKQYHLTGGKVDGVTTFLGYFESQINWTTIKLERKLKDTAQAFYAHVYTNGSVCDITGRPRSAEVRYLCDPHSSAEYSLRSINEPESCNYVINVHVGALCNSSMRPRSSDTAEHVAIRCSPVVDEATFVQVDERLAQEAASTLAQQAEVEEQQQSDPEQVGGQGQSTVQGETDTKRSVEAKKIEELSNVQTKNAPKQLDRSLFSDNNWAQAALRLSGDDGEEELFYEDEIGEPLEDEAFDILDLDLLIDIDENGKPVVRTFLRDVEEVQSDSNQQDESNEDQLGAKVTKKKTAAKRSFESNAENEDENIDSTGKKRSVDQRRRRRKTDPSVDEQSASESNSEETEEAQLELTIDKMLANAKRALNVQKKNVDHALSERNKFMKRLQETLNKLKSKSKSTELSSDSEERETLASDSEERETPASDSEEEASASDSEERAQDLRDPKASSRRSSQRRSAGKQKADKRLRKGNNAVDDVDILKLASAAVRKLLDEETDNRPYATKKDLENIDVRFVNGHRKPDEEVTPAEKSGSNGDSVVGPLDGENAVVRQFGNNVYLVELPSEAELQRTKKEKEAKQQHVELQREYNRLWNNAL